MIIDRTVKTMFAISEHIITIHCQPWQVIKADDQGQNKTLTSCWQFIWLILLF